MTKTQWLLTLFKAALPVTHAKGSECQVCWAALIDKHISAWTRVPKKQNATTQTSEPESASLQTLTFKMNCKDKYIFCYGLWHPFDKCCLRLHRYVISSQNRRSIAGCITSPVDCLKCFYWQKKLNPFHLPCSQCQAALLKADRWPDSWKSSSLWTKGLPDTSFWFKTGSLERLFLISFLTHLPFFFEGQVRTYGASNAIVWSINRNTILIGTKCTHAVSFPACLLWVVEIFIKVCQGFKMALLRFRLRMLLIGPGRKRLSH